MTDHQEQHNDHVKDGDNLEGSGADGEVDEDVVDGATTVISSLSSNTSPSVVVQRLVEREELVRSPPLLQRSHNNFANTTPAFGMKAVYARTEQAVEAGAAAAAQDGPDSEAGILQAEPRSSPQRPQQEQDQVPPLVPLARMPSVGKSVTSNNNNFNDNDDGSSFVTPPLPSPPQRMLRQSTPGAISVPGVNATAENEEQHDNLLTDDDNDNHNQFLQSPSSALTPAEQRPSTFSQSSYGSIPDSPPIVAELASTTLSYDEDLEDRIAERLEAQMTARLQQEVDRRLSQERRQHAIAEVVEPTKSKLSHHTTLAGEQRNEHNGNGQTATMMAMHVHEEENFKICGIRRTCWGMILCVLMLFIIGGVVGTILWLGREDDVITAPTQAPTTNLPTTISPSETPTTPLVDRRWDYLITELGPSIVPVNFDPMEYFSDPSTPQYEALVWMAATDLDTNVFETPRVILVERYVLATLFFSTGGPANWTEPLNFLSSESVCDWNSDMKGAFCSNSGPLVTRIVIPENGLQRFIPWELSLLEFLIQIQFDANVLTGSIPIEFGNLTMLQSLWIQSNSLTGVLPPELALATSLESVDLADNNIRSRLPSEWGPALSNLFFVRLRANEIAGTLPASWRDLSNLRVLDLEDNLLDGNLPNEYGLLTQLTSLYLESNNFQGTLPPDYGALTNLRNFFIYGNRLSGQIPTQYSNLSRLDNFWFHDNDLTGNVNDIFCLFRQIENMRADCQSDGPGLLPKVNCSCCTSCCLSDGTNCTDVS
ncbi:RHS repeat-associated core domain containing protein [Nitzschia inconspicua]|uniref:RHS repeat-associated core domain containing protein n=1 Tax=Nitzschia inconspicua TaxID=303405 RepID=A0A9K3KG59_9STRA|nr:RHS repeat-associated core domain containing protein [Nitzschia inconspicua]